MISRPMMEVIGRITLLLGIRREEKGRERERGRRKGHRGGDTVTLSEEAKRLLRASLEREEATAGGERR